MFLILVFKYGKTVYHQFLPEVRGRVKKIVTDTKVIMFQSLAFIFELRGSVYVGLGFLERTQLWPSNREKPIISTLLVMSR